MKMVRLHQPELKLIVGKGGPEEVFGVSISGTQADLNEWIKAGKPNKLPPPFIKKNVDENQSITIAPKF